MQKHILKRCAFFIGVFMPRLNAEQFILKRADALHKNLNFDNMTAAHLWICLAMRWAQKKGLKAAFNTLNLYQKDIYFKRIQKEM